MLASQTVDAVLQAGGWDQNADDTNQRERLPLSAVKLLVTCYPDDTRSIGLLSLTLSAGKWGVESDPTLPEDPAEDDWLGPTRASGKHLMSYKVGGVGLPHLDVGALAKFIDYLLANHSDIGDANECAYMKQLAEDLRRNTKYDEIKTNRTFLKWMRDGLRRRDAQVWVLEFWLDNYWEPALQASKNDVRLALVVSRIWNTSHGLGTCAAERALQSDDRIQAALEAYVHCPGGSESYRNRRWGWMKRPVVLFDAYKKYP